MAIGITFANQKGGVGKTSSAIILSKFFPLLKKTVLNVDLDPQGNMSHTLRADPKKGTIYDVLTKSKTMFEAIQTTYLGDCLCYSPSLAGTDKTLAGIGSEYLLKEAIKTVEDKYDYVIIDPPPALGLLTINALVASRFLIIPAQADIYSLQGIGQIMTTVENVKKYCNPELIVSGILITRFNNQTIISREMSRIIEDKAQKFGTKVFNTRIRECIAVKEAEAEQIDLLSYSPRCNASRDYCEFIKELLTGGNNDEKI